MKWLAVSLAVVIVLLQYRLWLSPDGVREFTRLQMALDRQQRQNAELHERNGQLAAEVVDLKDGYTAIEERARTDLGMIAPNETFYQVVAPGAATRAQSVASAPPHTRTAVTR
jgi:cell division protein FtsB